MTKPTEQLPEYYRSWDAMERFDDLKKAFDLYQAHRETCAALERDIAYETDTSSQHENAIAVLGHLVNDLSYGDNEIDKATSKFIKNYYGLEESLIEAYVSNNLQQSIKTLEKDKRAKFRSIVDLENDLWKEEVAEGKALAAYKKLDKKYEAQFDKLKKAEKLAQATEAANVDNFINNEYNEIEGEVA
tara:strand:+ start:126 stop:689 length:564 start_codon:yes stop_codon:yes gene_type:complete